MNDHTTLGKTYKIENASTNSSNVSTLCNSKAQSEYQRMRFGIGNDGEDEAAAEFDEAFHI